MKVKKFESFTRKDYRRWEISDIDEAKNPVFILKGTDLDLLSQIAKGEIDVKELAKRELEALGLDINAKWVGFDKKIDEAKSLTKYRLISQDTDETVFEYEIFNKEKMIEDIKSYISNNKKDVLEFYINDDLVDFYGINPKNDKVSLIITKGNKEYYKPLN